MCASSSLPRTSFFLMPYQSLKRLHNYNTKIKGEKAKKRARKGREMKLRLGGCAAPPGPSQPRHIENINCQIVVTLFFLLRRRLGVTDSPLKAAEPPSHGTRFAAPHWLLLRLSRSPFPLKQYYMVSKRNANCLEERKTAGRGGPGRICVPYFHAHPGTCEWLLSQ